MLAMSLLHHHWVELDHPRNCLMDEAQAAADRLREAGIDVSVVEAFGPSGQNILTGRSSLSPGGAQRYVLKVPPEQVDAARAVG